MYKVIITFGVMGSGKTSFAKMTADKYNYEYLNFDEKFSNAFGGRTQPFLNFISEKIKSSIHLIIIDGWFAWDEDKEKSIEFLQKSGIDVLFVYLFSPMWIMKDRYINKPNTTPMNADGNFNKSCSRILPLIDHAKILVKSIDMNFSEVTKDQLSLQEKEYTKEEMVKFLKNINTQENYQNIQFPFGLSTGGYKDCENSWEQIKDIVDWRRKKVLDIGTYWGYFAFEIKSMGAAEVTGTDIKDDVIETAKTFREMKKINVNFIKSNIDDDRIDGEYDIILLLNILHHLRSPFSVLKKAFHAGKIVIMEVELPHDQSLIDKAVVEMGEPIKLSNGKMGGHLRFSKQMLLRFASENGYSLKKEVKSFRPNRTILMFGR